MAFLLLKAEVGIWDRKRSRIFLTQELADRPTAVRGYTARAVLEIPSDKKPGPMPKPFSSERFSKTTGLGRDTFDIRWLTNGVGVSVKGPSIGDNTTLVHMATVTLGPKWVVNEARLRSLKPDVDMEFLWSHLDKNVTP